MSSKSRLRVVVDGSNFATENRKVPSLTQLDDAVRAFQDENPGAEVIVVVDASFEHRVASSERSKFKEAELAGEIVTPPAGAIGRGDAFILKIADRINAVVLSNDSFQEFQTQYKWLFNEGRLIGGKPVPTVGWVFTPRLPVRAAKSTHTTKKLAVALPNGAKPSIGTTLTPVKVAKTVKKTPVKPVKKTAKPIKKAATKKSAPVKKSTAKKIAKPTKKVAKQTAPVVALRRGRQPVNPEIDFSVFRSTFRVGSRVEGEVTAFTSHGAVIKVTIKGGKLIECYAPTTSLGSPAPVRARDVLKRGDKKLFKLVTVDSERRIAELSLP